MKKRYYFLLGIFILFVVFFLIVLQNTPQKQLEKIISEEISYSQFSGKGFSVLYPEWEDKTQGNVELSVSKGYCTVAINSENLPAQQWHEMLVDSINEQEGEIIDFSESNFEVKYSLIFQNHTFISENRIYECGGESTAVTINCLEEFEEVGERLSEKIFPSVSCEKNETKLRDYQDDDFSINYPEWDEINDGAGDQRLLGISKGVCSIIVDKHNALPKDIFNWLNKSIQEKQDHTILSSLENKEKYELVYQFPYNEKNMTADTKIFYCNYQSYITQVICVNEYVNEDYESIRESVLESSKCAREYVVPTPEKIEEEKEQVKEKEPEIIKEIEDEIVKTNVGEEFGIDEEMVVYFINSNSFFTKIMKDFPKANLVIEDKDNNRELKLKVSVDDVGKITLLEDGEHTDADVTLIVPLRDALNIFNNAENINPITLLSFAVNVKTEPVEIKNQVIQKFLRGEYN